MIKLRVGFDKPYKPFGQAEVKQIVSSAEKILKISKEFNIGVRVTSEAKSRELNNKYGGHDYATDVLSFNYQDGPASPIKDKQGDVVISYEHVHKQAQNAHTSASTELALLVLHGVLHIVGFDHQTDAQSENLEQLQSQIMKAAGLKYRSFDWQSTH